MVPKLRFQSQIPRNFPLIKLPRNLKPDHQFRPQLRGQSGLASFQNYRIVPEGGHKGTGEYPSSIRLKIPRELSTSKQNLPSTPISISATDSIHRAPLFRIAVPSATEYQGTSVRARSRKPGYVTSRDRATRGTAELISESEGRQTSRQSVVNRLKGGRGRPRREQGAGELDVAG